MIAELRPDERAPNLWVGAGVQIGEGVRIGANVVLHAGTVVGDGALIDDQAVVGKRPALAAHSAARAGLDELGPTQIGAGVTVCTGAVIFAGARIDAGAIVGDQTHVRERARVGEQTVVGRGSAIGNEAVLGARVRIQTAAWLTAWTVVEDDVFVGPGVMTMNDDTMARLAPGARLRAPVLRRACRVGGGVLLTPGVEVGEEAFVGAGAVVTHDVPPRTRTFGVPARALGAVPDEQLLERWR